MVMRASDVNWVIQKAADEGSQSPFMARILIGVLRCVTPRCIRFSALDYVMESIG